jgi:hypothetical protein
VTGVTGSRVAELLAEESIASDVPELVPDEITVEPEPEAGAEPDPEPDDPEPDEVELPDEAELEPAVGAGEVGWAVVRGGPNSKRRPERGAITYAVSVITSVEVTTSVCQV